MLGPTCWRWLGRPEVSFRIHQSLQLCNHDYYKFNVIITEISHNLMSIIIWSALTVYFIEKQNCHLNEVKQVQTGFASSGSAEPNLRQEANSTCAWSWRGGYTCVFAHIVELFPFYCTYFTFEHFVVTRAKGLKEGWPRGLMPRGLMPRGLMPWVQSPATLPFIQALSHFKMTRLGL